MPSTSTEDFEFHTIDVGLPQTDREGLVAREGQATPTTYSFTVPFEA